MSGDVISRNLKRPPGGDSKNSSGGWTAVYHPCRGCGKTMRLAGVFPVRNWGRMRDGKCGGGWMNRIDEIEKKAE